MSCFYAFLFALSDFMDDDEDEEGALLPGMSLKKKKEEEKGDSTSPSVVGIEHHSILYNDSRDSMPFINDSTQGLPRTRSLLWAPRESPPAARRGHRKKQTHLLVLHGTTDPLLTGSKTSFRTREGREIEHRAKGSRLESKAKIRGRSEGQQRGENAEFKNSHITLEEQVMYGRSNIVEEHKNVDLRPTKESKSDVTTVEGNVKEKPMTSEKQEPDKVYVTRLLSGVRKTRGQVFPGMLLPKPKPHRTYRLREHPHIPTPPKMTHGGRRSRPWTPPDTSELGLFSWEGQTEVPGLPIPTSPSLPGGPPLISSEAPPEELQDYSYEDAEPRQMWPEDAINWQRTFSVGNVDFEMLRSDWNDLRCNVSGNLQLSESETVDLVAQYMEKLNEKNGG